MFSIPYNNEDADAYLCAIEEFRDNIDSIFFSAEWMFKSHGAYSINKISPDRAIIKKII